MGGRQFFFFFGRTWGALKDQKEGLGERGLEFPFIRPHFHSFVFDTLPYFGVMLEGGS